ncbi:MAG TPA: hypothetical protein VN778_03860 [Verrucomicrobiae bacterium]|nr:hypothetical protein [Verrucomicrobiae bacterium]
MALREELQTLSREQAIVATQAVIDRLNRGEAEQAVMDHVLDNDYQAFAAAVNFLYETSIDGGLDSTEAAFMAIGARTLLHIQRELAEQQLFAPEDLSELSEES